MAKNNNEKRNFNNSNQKKDEKNYVTAKLYLPEGINSDLYNEIIDVLKNTQFGKISFPLSAYRKDIFDNVEDGDNRVSTAGYINRFDQNKNEFVIVTYNNLTNTINAFKNPAIEVVYTTRKSGGLGVITKLVVIDHFVDDHKEESEEDPNEVPVVEEKETEMVHNESKSAGGTTIGDLIDIPNIENTEPVE